MSLCHVPGCGRDVFRWRHYDKCQSSKPCVFRSRNAEVRSLWIEIIKTKSNAINIGVCDIHFKKEDFMPYRGGSQQDKPAHLVNWKRKRVSIPKLYLNKEKNLQAKQLAQKCGVLDWWTLIDDPEEPGLEEYEKIAKSLEKTELVIPPTLILPVNLPGKNIDYTPPLLDITLKPPNLSSQPLKLSTSSLLYDEPLISCPTSEDSIHAKPTKKMKRLTYLDKRVKKLRSVLMAGSKQNSSNTIKTEAPDIKQKCMIDSSIAIPDDSANDIELFDNDFGMDASDFMMDEVSMDVVDNKLDIFTSEKDITNEFTELKTSPTSGEVSTTSEVTTELVNKTPTNKYVSWKVLEPEDVKVNVASLAGDVPIASFTPGGTDITTMPDKYLFSKISTFPLRLPAKSWAVHTNTDSVLICEVAFTDKFSVVRGIHFSAEDVQNPVIQLQGRNISVSAQLHTVADVENLVKKISTLPLCPGFKNVSVVLNKDCSGIGRMQAGKIIECQSCSISQTMMKKPRKQQHCLAGK